MKDIPDEIQELYDPSIESNVPEMFPDPET